MKLKPDHKVYFLFVGFIFAWIAVYVMLADFYNGIAEVTVATVEDGTYRPYYLRGENMVWWGICMLISSMCLAIGLKAEEITVK